MGQLIAFYAGDADLIGAAFSAQDFETLEDRGRVPLGVDFSFHLTPTDIDLLTGEAWTIVGSGPVSMTESFVRRVGGDGDEASADLLPDDWVRMIAAVPDTRVAELANAWMRAFAAEYGQPAADANPEIREALAELVRLCREARDKRLAVVHAWSL